MVKCCGNKYGFFVKCEHCRHDFNGHECVTHRRSTKYHMLDIYPKDLESPIIDLWKDSDIGKQGV